MAQPTQYNVNKYIQGVNGFGLLPSANNYSTTLAAATVATLTVPNTSAMGYANASTTYNRFVAIFSYEAAKNVYVAVNATAAVPAGNTIAATTGALNPNALLVKGGDVISIICADAGTDVGIRLYAVQEG